MRVAFTSASSEEGYFAVSIAHRDGLPALGKYNEGVRIITANGRLEQIRARWTTRP